MEKQTELSQQPEKKLNLSARFLDTIKDSLTGFAKISEEERFRLYGDQEFLEQFREYFKKENPDVLGLLKKEELPAYLTALEKKGFSLHTLIHSNDKLHREFAPEKPERQVMEETLGRFDAFCKDGSNTMPAGIFQRFASEAGFDVNTYNIPQGSTLQTIDDLYLLWKKFVEKENIQLKENQQKNIEQLLCPTYDPVERIMIHVAITKLRKVLPTGLRADFDLRFPLPLTAFSSLGDLLVFKNARLMFVDEHADRIDENLAKKLDEVMVTNGDIKKLLAESGKKFDISKGYEEWERYFLRVFNKLATRQLFEEIKDTEQAIEKYVDIIAEGVKGFPPYVNEIFKIYPYHDKQIANIDPSLHGQLDRVDAQISQLQQAIANDKTSKEERAELRKKVKALKQQREEMKRQSYLRYLTTKNASLAAILANLAGSHFDFARLSLEEQQTLLNILVQHKLTDLLQHKAPELLSVNQDDLERFARELFDLSSMDLTIPTREGPVHIRFKEKKFLSQKADHLLAINDLADIQSFPLQFVVKPTPSSQEFFERGVLRGHDGGQLFDTFQSKNGPVILNDGYKVKIANAEGQAVEGYLSQVAPADAAEDMTGTKWYLYSKPVITISQEREKMFRSGTDQPVVIDEQNEPNYSIDVLDRSFTLNGEAIGSLIFAYVLGQQSFNNEISPQQENELAKKISKLDTYLDKQATRMPEELEEEVVQEENQVVSEKKEKTYYDIFLDQRKQLDGYNFSEDKESAGFTPGTRLYVKTGESELPPPGVASSAWMYLDILKINKEKGTFTVSIHGGEYGLGKYEGAKKELPIAENALDSIKNILGSDIYKVPDMSGKSFEEQLGVLKGILGEEYAQNFAYTFDTVKSEGGGFVITQGDFAGEKVAGFGYDMKIPEYDDNARRTIEKIVPVVFEVKRYANGDYHVSCKNDLVDAEGKSVEKFSRDMDPISFALFIAGKKLQPKTSDDVKQSKEIAATNADKGAKKRRRPFSINNIIGFFKTSVAKVKESIKKYDEERTEDLTDILLQNGDIFTKFGKAFSGISKRIGTSFEDAGMEYYTTRDARIWKKIEKWQKVFEQEKHYPSFYGKILKPMLEGKEVPKDIYKIPAMLLTIINKEKSPYARNLNLVGKGHRVNLILGKNHQQRYLNILNEKMVDIRQNSELYGGGRTVHRNEEIIKLEMKYIVDVIDMRELGVGAEEKYQAAKWSRTFAEKLDEAMRTKFGLNTIKEKRNDESAGKSKTFEFAEYEYARHTRNGKPANAFPFLKIMAEQAQTPAQWQQFEMHVVSSTLSGWFLYGTDADTKGWLKDICRSRGFIPGLFAKDIHQQSKMLMLINIFLKSSGKKFEDFSMSVKGKSINFSLDKFTMGNMDNMGGFVADGFKTWRFNERNGEKFSKFLQFTGKDSKGQKGLLDLLYDPMLSESEKSIIREYISLSNESSEDLDPEVKHNFSAMAGTPFTKCETLTRELMKYEDGEFAGKDSFERMGPALFWNEVAKGLPRECKNKGELKFFIGKFFNWFESYGFAEGDQKAHFIKRLVTVQKMFDSSDPKVQKQAEDMLWYIINGTILSYNSSGRGTPPSAFEKALNAFKTFFKTNLSMILSPEIISSAVGFAYANDQTNLDSYGIGDRGEYVMLKTPAAMMGKKGEKNRLLKQKYASGKYAIYDELYRVAEDLVRKGQTNRFKSYYQYEEGENLEESKMPQIGTPKLSKSGIAISNPKKIQEEIKKTLSGQNKKESDEEDEEAALLQEYEHEFE